MKERIDRDMRAIALGTTIASHTGKETSAPGDAMQELVDILANNPETLENFLHLQRGGEVTLIDNSQK